MDLVYFSLTGNCKRFSERVNPNAISLEDYLGENSFYLVTPTSGFGEIPSKVVEFLDNFSEKCEGVISSGNRNWGKNFAVSGDLIERRYKIKNILKIELSGTNQDVVQLKNKLEA